MNFKGKEYYLDLPKINEIIRINNKNDEPSHKEITETYVMVNEGTKEEPKMVKKLVNINEITKIEKDKKIDIPSYEMIMSMIDVLKMPGVGEGYDEKLDNGEFSFSLAFNTLIKYEILKIKE